MDEILKRIEGLSLCVELHRAGEALSGYHVSHVEVPVRSLEIVLEALRTQTQSGIDNGD